jgi:MoxR-like ATPase
MSEQVSPRQLESDREASHEALDRVRSFLNQALRGKQEVVNDLLICLLARGHLLIEDKPGLGKTTLAKATAAAMGGRFARVQCTPDLLPSDITGFNIFNQRTQEFEFRPGPVFADVLLADEINRATPRTQSALLEAMAERQVTVDTQRHGLCDEFFVIATQNPDDQHGTYPLPEAQLDRFAMKLSIGYPDRDDEMQMLRDAVQQADEPLRLHQPILSPRQLRGVQQLVAKVWVAPAIQEYLVNLAHATRNHPRVLVGLSPRAVLVLQRAAQARAFLQHRGWVVPDDIHDVAGPVFSVRLTVDQDEPESVIREVLDTVPVPTHDRSQLEETIG